MYVTPDPAEEIALPFNDDSQLVMTKIHIHNRQLFSVEVIQHDNSDETDQRRERTTTQHLSERLT